MSLRAEACELSKLATPIMAVSMLQFLMVMVDMAMVGRLGTAHCDTTTLPRVPPVAPQIISSCMARYSRWKPR